LTLKTFRAAAWYKAQTICQRTHAACFFRNIAIFGDQLIPAAIKRLFPNNMAAWQSEIT
jgi:hypothetical protein